jgi:predicted signal transduction protein with EAL and GGDEF domain
MLDREGYGGPADVAIIGNEDEVSRQIDAIAALGVEELSGYVFAHTAEDDERTPTCSHPGPACADPPPRAAW